MKNTAIHWNEHVESHTSYVQDKTTNCPLLCKEKRSSKSGDGAASLRRSLYSPPIRCVVHRQAGNMQLPVLHVCWTAIHACSRYAADMQQRG